MLVCTHSLLALFQEGSGAMREYKKGGGEEVKVNIIKSGLTCRSKFFLSWAIQWEETEKVKKASCRPEGPDGAGQAGGRNT